MGMINPKGKGIMIMEGTAPINPPMTNKIPTINDAPITLPKTLVT